MEPCVINGVRCTKCCQAIHILKQVAFHIWKGDSEMRYIDQDKIRSKWVPISKRRAKKINPYMFSTGESYQHMSFFKCKVLTKDGCGDYDDRPDVCKAYGRKGSSSGMYSPDCNIFAISED